MFLCVLAGTGGGFQEVLGEALQHAAGFIDRDFFGGIETAGHRYFDAFAVLAMDDQGEVRARAALAGHKVATPADLGAVAAMALRHRLRKNPLDDSGSAVRIRRALDELLPV